LAADYNGKVKFVKVNAHSNLRLLQKYRVQAIPTLLFFKQGERQSELIGRQSKESIQSRLAPLL